MKTDPNGPAHTTMMGVIHDALRRDLKRLHDALTAPKSPTSARRIEIANHAVWMMDFLHEHHHNEDIGLWPFVCARNPEAGRLMGSMEADHQAIEPLVANLRTAAEQCRGDDSPAATTQLVDAIAALSAPLLAHLEREENEALPVVSASITNREWQRIENKHNVRGKSLPRLATEGHWAADGLDPRRYDVLVHLVPAPVRAVILKGFAGRYYAACARRWGPELDCRPSAASDPHS
jgi:hemerythrin-like domain-containing protein